MDEKFALFKRWELVGALGITGTPAIQNGVRFTDPNFTGGLPAGPGEGNRLKLALAADVTQPNPYANITTFEVYLRWFANPQRYLEGQGTAIPPGVNTAKEHLEAFDAAGPNADTRVHEMKYYTYKLPITTPPPVPLEPGLIAPDFQWDLIAPMDHFFAYIVITPAGPFPGGLYLYFTTGANAE
jgi:hypothetical protein